jgi:hypothetical protein
MVRLRESPSQITRKGYRMDFLVARSMAATGIRCYCAWGGVDRDAELPKTELQSLCF